jgi:hypothetical protein
MLTGLEDFFWKKLNKNRLLSFPNELLDSGGMPIANE